MLNVKQTELVTNLRMNFFSNISELFLWIWE